MLDIIVYVNNLVYKDIIYKVSWQDPLAYCNQYKILHHVFVSGNQRSYTPPGNHRVTLIVPDKWYLLLETDETFEQFLAKLKGKFEVGEAGSGYVFYEITN